MKADSFYPGEGNNWSVYQNPNLSGDAQRVSISLASFVALISPLHLAACEQTQLKDSIGTPVPAQYRTSRQVHQLSASHESKGVCKDPSRISSQISSPVKSQSVKTGSGIYIT